MTHKSITEQQARAFVEKREAMIKEYGFMVQVVGGGPGPGEHPFAYTIGLHDKGLPELFISGRVMSVFQMILNNVAEAAIKGPGILTRKSVYKTDKINVPLQLLPVGNLPEEKALGAKARSRDQATYVVVVWPDENGVFPTEGVTDNADQFYTHITH